jgi:hypothetical protein
MTEPQAQQPELNSEPVAQDAPEPQQPESGGNPAWKGMLDQLPAEFHKVVEPHLKQWDDRFRGEQEKYAAYKPYLDNGIQPDTINQALQFLQAVNTRPQDVYNWLVQQPGITPQQAAQVADQVDEIGGDEDPNDARLKAIEAQNQEIQKIIQREAERVEEDKFYSRIDQDMNALAKHYGFNEAAGKRIMQFAFQNFERSGKFDLQAAYNDYQSFVAEVRSQPRANDFAPNVLPTGGGVPPAPSTNFATMDSDERAEHFKRAMDEARRQQA